jgi:hypothetical protein
VHQGTSRFCVPIEWNKHAESREIRHQNVGFIIVSSTWFIKNWEAPFSRKSAFTSLYLIFHWWHWVSNSSLPWHPNGKDLNVTSFLMVI